MTKTVADIVREMESDFTSGTGVLMSEYVRQDLYKDINTIYAYLNSKHITGLTDSLGREKPFFNIVLAARNIWFRATDIDRKDITLTAGKAEDTVAAFIMSLLLEKWMKENDFGTFLNHWGMELASFNEAVIKVVEKKGELIMSVVPWSRLIIDPINFADNPVIEKLELTESQMRERFDTEAVDSLVAAKQAREVSKGQRKDDKNNYYLLYEVHGKFPLSEITDKEKDESTFVQQMHVITFVGKGGDGKEVEKFTLFRGLEKDHPYYLTALLPNTDGSVTVNGSVKNLFEAQWMVNQTAKQIYDQMTLASKLFFQTSDPQFLNSNVIETLETGDVLIHQPNQPLTQVNNGSHDITALQNTGADWRQLGQEINGISDAMLGAQPKAGTAWRQTEALLQENYSLFEIMTENKGLYLKQIIRQRILPFLIAKSGNKDQIAALLDSHKIKKVDAKYLPHETLKRVAADMIDEIIENGDVPTDITDRIGKAKRDVEAELDEQGMRRYFTPDELGKKTWKDLLKGKEMDVEIDITGESKNKQAIFSTLNTVLSVIANPGFEQNPKAQLVVDKILTATGHISPLELASVNSAQATQQVAAAPPAGGPAPELSAVTPQ